MYALAAVPHLLPSLHTWSEVSAKIISGADLFLQGVLVPEGGVAPFLVGSARSISVPGNPVPFAVGTMAVSSAEAAREGMKGRGVTVLHCFGDLLWGFGPQTLPNDGFTPTRINPCSRHPDDHDGTPTTPRDSAAAALLQIELDRLAVEGDVDTAQTRLKDYAEEKKEEQKKEEIEVQQQEEASPVVVVDIDPILEAAVLGGLKAVKSGDLPLLLSDFYQKYMLPLRPNGVTFDFKASKKYKKLSKLLDKYEKEKVVTVKQIRKQDHVSAVNRTHPLIEGWLGMPEVITTTTMDNGGSSSIGGSSSSSSTANPTAGVATAPAMKASSSISKPNQMKVEYLYKVSTSLRPIFTATSSAASPASVDTTKDHLFSADEVSAALSTYASTHSLLSCQQNGTTAIKLDHLLVSGMFGKKECQEGAIVPFKELLGRLLSKLQCWHRLTLPQEGGGGGAAASVLEVVRKGTVKPITIVADRKNGRNVTIVSRVEGFGFTADSLASDFQRRFKTACSVSKLPGRTESDYEILMQGDCLTKVAAFFAEVNGIDAAFLEVNNKLTAKKKK